MMSSTYQKMGLSPDPPLYLFICSIMASANGGESVNPAGKTFRKYSAQLLTAIQDPEVLAWDLYSVDIISQAVRDSATNTMHERRVRTSKLLEAVESQISLDPNTFDVFLSVLAKRHEMNDLCKRMKKSWKIALDASSRQGMGDLDQKTREQGSHGPPAPCHTAWMEVRRREKLTPEEIRTLNEHNRAAISAAFDRAIKQVVRETS